MTGPTITFTTDYGLADGFVGVCHAVILRGCPDARVIDLGHVVPRHDVRAGALLLSASVEFVAPPDAVHLAVVDPGVGTDRRAVALRTASGAWFVGPDNGLLTPGAERAGGVVEALDIGRSRYALEPISATFHGRDLFAPVAAVLAAARGGAVSKLGEPIDPAGLLPLALTHAARDGDALVTHVQYVDQFGNLQLDGNAEDLRWVTSVDQVMITSLTWDLPPQAVHHGVTFGDVEAGELVLYEDAHRRPAIAVNRGSAAERLGVHVGAELRIAPA